MYGCELWNLENPAIDKLCKVWHAGLYGVIGIYRITVTQLYHNC